MIKRNKRHFHKGCLQNMSPINYSRLSGAAENTVISFNFLVPKFCGKIQFPHSFRWIAETVPFHKISTPGNSAFPQNFDTVPLNPQSSIPWEIICENARRERRCNCLCQAKNKLLSKFSPPRLYWSSLTSKFWKNFQTSTLLHQLPSSPPIC